jgi:N-acetylmuramoyl-L-alanine amidase
MMKNNTKAASGLLILAFIFLLEFPVFAQNATLNIDEALAALGGTGKTELRWDPFFASGALISGEHELAFVSGKKGETGMVLLDHKYVLTLPLPYLEKGALRFPESFINQVKSGFNRYAEEDHSRFRIAAIIIDAGHGGKDEGTAWSYEVLGKTVKVREKDVALKVSLQLRSVLQAAFPDKRVFLTRDGDTNPSKDERVEIANSLPLKDNEVAIFVSVHANSSLSNRTARGFEVWYLSPGYRRELIDHSRYADTKDVIPILNSMLEEETTTESIILANSILKRLHESIGASSPNRGLKADDFIVVRKARMPSVLVELGFLSNREEALLMNDDGYLKKLSEALYKGISDFVVFFERSGGFTALQ